MHNSSKYINRLCQGFLQTLPAASARTGCVTSSKFARKALQEIEEKWRNKSILCLEENRKWHVVGSDQPQLLVNQCHLSTVTLVWQSPALQRAMWLLRNVSPCPYSPYREKQTWKAMWLRLPMVILDFFPDVKSFWVCRDMSQALKYKSQPVSNAPCTMPHTQLHTKTLLDSGTLAVSKD